MARVQVNIAKALGISRPVLDEESGKLKTNTQERHLESTVTTVGLAVFVGVVVVLGVLTAIHLESIDSVETEDCKVELRPIDSIPSIQRDALSRTIFFFGHQSVAWNVPFMDAGFTADVGHLNDFARNEDRPEASDRVG